MDDYSSGFCIRASRGGGGGGTGTKCGRWNPTSEQVKVLTELFRSGLRTPTTDQIQKISSELSFYGKIESKNVFYWFQNHKARERQKRRRVLVDDDQDQIILHNDNHSKNISTKNIAHETNDQVSMPAERVIETLQLFPLNTSSRRNDTDSSDNLRLYANNWKEINSSYAYSLGTEMDHPMLDLRLSFV